MVQKQAEELDARKNSETFDAERLEEAFGILDERRRTFLSVQAERHLRFLRKHSLITHRIETCDARVNHIQGLLHAFELLFCG